MISPSLEISFQEKENPALRPGSQGGKENYSAAAKFKIISESKALLNNLFLLASKVPLTLTDFSATPSVSAITPQLMGYVKPPSTVQGDYGAGCRRCRVISIGSIQSDS